jgi:hypothetical protein
MSFLIPFAISIAVTAVSVIIQNLAAEDRADKLEKLAAEKLRLQQDRAAIEKEESARKIKTQGRILTAKLVNRMWAGGTSAEGTDTSANLARQSIISGVKGASTLLDKRFQSVLALQQSDFDIATFDSTPGLAEQLVTGALGAVGSTASTYAGVELEKKVTGNKSIWS